MSDFSVCSRSASLVSLPEASHNRADYQQITVKLWDNAQDLSCVGPDEVNCTVVTTLDCLVNPGNPVKLAGTFDEGDLWSILAIQCRCCIGISKVVLVYLNDQVFLLQSSETWSLVSGT